MIGLLALIGWCTIALLILLVGAAGLHASLSVAQRRKPVVPIQFFKRPPLDPWDDVLVTHKAVIDGLPASLRSDFTSPSPFAALAALGVSTGDLERWASPTRAELHAGIRR